MNRTFTLVFALISIFCFETFGQRKFVGRVVDVVDGKTVVIETNAGRITTVMQYIDVPEPEQPLHQTVKDHLRKLLLGKTVDFNPQGIGTAQTIGQLYLGSTDVAQQMIRDGAAWHVPTNRTGQGTREGAVYEDQQIQARAEKRGVWSIANLKPAWQVRAEREENQRLKEKLAREEAERKDKEARFAEKGPARAKNAGVWSAANPDVKDVGPLLNGYNEQTKTGYLATPPLGVSDMQQEGFKAMAWRFSYVYSKAKKDRKEGTFYIRIDSISDEWKFLASTDLTLLVDDQKIFIGKAKRTTFKDTFSSGESLVYEVKRGAIDKIVNGADVQATVGKYLFKPTYGLQLILYNLLKSSE